MRVVTRAKATVSSTTADSSNSDTDLGATLLLTVHDCGNREHELHLHLQTPKSAPTPVSALALMDQLIASPPPATVPVPKACVPVVRADGAPPLKKLPSIFCDLDGVLADFVQGVRYVTAEKGCPEGYVPEMLGDTKMWKALQKVQGFLSGGKGGGREMEAGTASKAVPPARLASAAAAHDQESTTGKSARTESVTGTSTSTATSTSTSSASSSSSSSGQVASLFSTGAGKPVQISSERLKKAEELLAEDGDPGAPSTAPSVAISPAVLSETATVQAGVVEGAPETLSVPVRKGGFFAALPWCDGAQELWRFISAQRRPEPQAQPQFQTKQVSQLRNQTRPPPARVAILTALPRGKWAEPQKREWCATYLVDPMHTTSSPSPTSIPGLEVGLGDVEVLTCMRSQKQRYALETLAKGDDALLIDDNKFTCSEWRARGGLAIHHTTGPEGVKETIRRLREMGYADPEQTRPSTTNAVKAIAVSAATGQAERDQGGEHAEQMDIVPREPGAEAGAEGGTELKKAKDQATNEDGRSALAVAGAMVAGGTAAEDDISLEKAFNSSLQLVARTPPSDPEQLSPVAATAVDAGASISGIDRAALVLQLLYEPASREGGEVVGLAAEASKGSAKEECLRRLHALVKPKVFSFKVRTTGEDESCDASPEILGVASEQQQVSVGSGNSGEFEEFDDFDYEALGCF
jgi:hypothetical protein